MGPADCPFRTADQILSAGAGLGKIIAVEIHGEATSEENRHGQVPGRTSQCGRWKSYARPDVGRNDSSEGRRRISPILDDGIEDSVLGREVESILRKFLTGMPSPFELASKDVCLEGVLIAVDEKTGRAGRIKRVREKIKDTTA